jgi:hypothetical protein
VTAKLEGCWTIVGGKAVTVSVAIALVTAPKALVTTTV